MVGIEFFFCAHIMRGFRISRKLQKDNLIWDKAHASMIVMDSIIFCDFKTKLKLNKRLGFWWCLMFLLPPHGGGGFQGSMWAHMGLMDRDECIVLCLVTYQAHTKRLNRVVRCAPYFSQWILKVTKRNYFSLIF